MRGFSAKSRKNISDNVQILDYQKLTDNDRIKAKFVTLTYPENYPDPKLAKKHLQILFKRLKRKFPKSSAVWKYEPQKSGAPHFHIMLYNLPYLAKEELSAMWLEIIGDEYADYSQGYKRAPFTRIETIRSHKGCASYVSKYIAKNDDSKGTASSPIRGAGFNSLPYLTAERFKAHPEIIDAVIDRALEAGEECTYIVGEDKERVFLSWLNVILKKYITDEELDILCPSIGRVWGKFNKKYMSSLKKRSLSFPYDKETIRALKTYCEMHRGGTFNKNSDDGGFTFYFNFECELDYFYVTLGKMLDKVAA